jgi:hypothetical protein
MFPRNIIYFSWRNQTLSPDIYKFTRSAWTRRFFWGEAYFRVLISSKNHSIHIYICMYVYLIVETAIYFRIAYTKKHIFQGT